jgi:ureidoacrylate peracid hydrolase
MIKDATAGFSTEEMRAALEVNLPNYASAIVTAEEIIPALKGWL